MTLNRILAASALVVAANAPVHAGGVLTGNTISFPVTSAWQVARAWPESGVVCNSTTGAVSCDLEAGAYTWHDWSDGTSDNIEVVESSAPAPEGNLPMAPSLSIEYVSGEGGFATGSSGDIVGIDGSVTFKAEAQCPAGSVLSGITQCEAVLIGGGGDQTPFPAQFRMFEGRASCAVHHLDAVKPFVPRSDATRLDIFVQIACLSI